MRCGVSRRPLGEGGFSLVEMVVVLVITAVLVALVLPDFNRIAARLQLDTTARRMAADIRETRERTQTEQAVYGLRFYPAADRYDILECSGPVARRVERALMPAQVSLVSAGFSGEILTFNIYSGMPSWNGTVSLMNRTNGEFRYVIVSATGRVRVSSELP